MSCGCPCIVTIIKCVCMREREEREKEGGREGGREGSKKEKERKKRKNLQGTSLVPHCAFLPFLTQITWVQIMFPPLGASSCDSLGKQPSLSMLQFLVQDNNGTCPL